MFHTNAVDIGNSYDYGYKISKTLQVHVLLVEYPGYGIYKGVANEKQIYQDSLTVFDFLINEIGFKEYHVLVMGRSLGSGPAIFLSCHRCPRMIFLISPFISIKKVTSELFGKLASYMVGDYFKNVDNIPFVRCPVLFIHGMNDDLVDYKHS